MPVPGPFVTVGFDNMYSSPPQPLPNSASPTAVLLTGPVGSLITMSTYSSTGTAAQNGVGLYIRSWVNGAGNGYLAQGWNGSQITTAGANGWNPSTPGTTWGPFAAGGGQTWSIIAQTQSGVLVLQPAILITPASGQAQNTNITAVFTGVDTSGNTSTITVSITVGVPAR